MLKILSKSGKGDKDYQVRAVYKKQGVSPVSEKITVKDYSGVADTASDAEGVSITRRGRNIIINGDFASARLYAPDGRMVRSISQPPDFDYASPILIMGRYRAFRRVTEAAVARQSRRSSEFSAPR